MIFTLRGSIKDSPIVFKFNHHHLGFPNFKIISESDQQPKSWLKITLSVDIWVELSQSLQFKTLKSACIFVTRDTNKSLATCKIYDLSPPIGFRKNLEFLDMFGLAEMPVLVIEC